MLLSEICIKRPVFATVLNLILIALGLIFFSKLQIRGIPDIDPPIITISSPYPGADALYMEKEITTRLEQSLKTIKNLDFMSSSSSDGDSSITLSFKLGTDIEIALSDVRSKISSASRSFPSNMSLPAASKLDSDSFQSLWITINSDNHDAMELTRIASDDIKAPLEKLDSVGRVYIAGGNYYSMRVEPNPIKMYQYQISPIEIEAAVKQQNNDYPAGLLKTTVRNLNVSLRGSLFTPEEFENIIIKKQGSGFIKLKDIAKVALAPAENDVIFRYNSKKAIALGISKQSKSNVLDLSKEVRKELTKINANLPYGVTAVVAFDNSIAIDASIKSVYKTLVESLFLVLVVTYLFLGSVKITIIPLVTIPVSLIGTFSAMYLFGFSINTFTLLAIILAIGLVVDDAIVMLENVYRHNELGENSVTASLKASKEIGFAIIAMTITLAAVFLPIGFIEGFLGKLFVEFAWTLAFSVLFSGFVALTLTPMMCSKMIGKQDSSLPYFLHKFNGYLNIIKDKYQQLLKLAVQYKRAFLLISSSSIIILVISLIFVNKIFVPLEDDGYIQISLTGPEGSSYAASEKTLIEVENILSNYKDIAGYFGIVGYNGSGDSAIAFVPLKSWSERKLSQSAIKNQLNAKFFTISAMSIFAIDPRSLASGGSKKAIEFNLQTSLNYKELDNLSKNFVDELSHSPIFQNAERSLKSSIPSVDIIVNRDKAYMYNVSLDQIGNNISYLIAGKKIGDFRMGNDIYDVLLQYNISKRNELNSLDNIYIKNQNNSLVPLGVIADFKETITINSYTHYNSSKSVQISSDLTPGYKISDAIEFINKLQDKLLDSSTTKLEFLGEISRMKESNSNILSTFLFALVFIYLILCAQFESFADPLLILLAVPFSITGGVLALLVSGDSINMYSNIGLVTLIGLITKNSIMIVEFTNQLREEGYKKYEAVIEASTLRLRPILMTSCATIFGAIPLITTSGAGAAARHSIGIVIVGGMMIGTLFTIFVIPVLYYTFKRE